MRILNIFKRRRETRGLPTQPQDINGFELTESTETKSLSSPQVILVTEGVGIGEIMIDHSTPQDVIKYFGKDHEQRTYPRHWTSHPIAQDLQCMYLTYRNLGICFSFFEPASCKTTKTLFSISLYKPCMAQTSKGVSLGKTRIGEAIALYKSLDRFGIWTNNFSTYSFTFQLLGITCSAAIPGDR